MQQVRALCEWMGERAEVTSTGVLHPAAAHEVYDALGLSAWTEQQLRRQYQPWQLAGVRKMGAEAWIAERLHEPWRNAGDSPALDRLWRGAIACGAVEVAGRWAYPRFPTDPDDERWTLMGVNAVYELLEDRCEYPFRAFGLGYGLLRSYVLKRARVPWDEIAGFVRDWEGSPEEQAHYRSIGYDPTGMDRSRLATAFGAVADTGIVVESEQGVALTEFGDVAVSSWLSYRKGGG